MTRQSWAKVALVAVAVVVAVTCFPSHPFDGKRFTSAPLAWEPWHKTAYAEVAACLGKPTKFPRLSFYVVDGREEWAGLYSNKRIYLHRRYLADTGLLKHEFVHHLEGIEGHGPMFLRFKECGFAPDLGIW